MNIQVTITHELGEATKAFIIGLISANGGAVAPTAAPSQNANPEEKPARTRAAKQEVEEVEEAPKPRGRRPSAPVEDFEDEIEEAPKPRGRRPSTPTEMQEEEAPKPRGRRPSAPVEEAPAPKKAAAPTLEDQLNAFKALKTDAKLEEIKSQITLTTKKKGGAGDVREILGAFDAGRAGELAAVDYLEFYTALMEYRGGKSVDEIFPQID